MKLFKPCNFGITAHHKYFRIKKSEPLFFIMLIKLIVLFILLYSLLMSSEHRGIFTSVFLHPSLIYNLKAKQFLTPHKNKLSIFKFNYPIFVDYFQALSCSMGLFCFVFRHWIKNINVRKKTDPLTLCSFTKHPLLKISLH